LTEETTRFKKLAKKGKKKKSGKKKLSLKKASSIFLISMRKVTIGWRNDDGAENVIDVMSPYYI
jgi:hypothetical protein